MVCAFQAKAENAVDSLRKYVICRNGSAVRTLRVEKDPENPARWLTYYTKSGKDQVVGEGLNPVSCDGVLNRVQKTLESASWKCRAIANPTIHRETAAN